MPDTPVQPPPPADHRLRQRVRRYALGLVAVALLLAVIGISLRLMERSALAKRTHADAELTVTTTKPDLSTAGDELVLPGTVQAFIQAPIYARTSGYLKAWYTDIGTRVHKGQRLADIDTPEVDRQLRQAEADLATAQANLTLSKTTNARWQRLLVTQSVSQQDAEEKAGDLAAKTASVKSSAENVARLRELEDFKHVVAPFDGVVTARNTDVGALINAGQASGTQLFQVADTQRLRIYAEVPEAYAEAASSGLPAELHFGEQAGKSYPAKTVRTSHALDPSARTLQVELELDNSKGEIFPGAYTEVHFKVPASARTLRLPANTILFRAAGVQVGVVDAQSKIQLKNVQMGRDFGKTVEILSGLDPNDRVVVNPPDSMLGGEPVRIAQKPAAPTNSTPQQQ
jgi:RND family efflux transporter MFP subunit